MMVIVPQHIRDLCVRLERSLEQNSYFSTLKKVRLLEREQNNGRWILRNTRAIVELTEELLDIAMILPSPEYAKVYVENYIYPDVFFALNAVRERRQLKSEVSSFAQRWIEQINPTAPDCIMRQTELVRSDAKWEKLKKDGLNDGVDGEIFSILKVGIMYTRKNTEFPKGIIDRERKEITIASREEEVAFRYLFRIGTTEKCYVQLPSLK